MSRSDLIRRVARLEAHKHAVDARPPSLDEMMAEAAGRPVRPVVAALAARMRAFTIELDPWGWMDATG